MIVTTCQRHGVRLTIKGKLTHETFADVRSHFRIGNYATCRAELILSFLKPSKSATMWKGGLKRQKGCRNDNSQNHFLLLSLVERTSFPRLASCSFCSICACTSVLNTEEFGIAWIDDSESLHCASKALKASEKPIISGLKLWLSSSKGLGADRDVKGWDRGVGS